MNEAQKQQVLKQLSANKMAVISTVSADGPESALIGFAEDTELNLYFQTQNTTRKAQNLEGNQHVSFVIGTELKLLTTLQYEGIAEPVSEKGRDNAKKLFRQKDSPAVPFLDKPNVTLYKVTPIWLRYSNYKDRNVWEYQF